MYYLVYQRHTDGDILIEPYNSKADLYERVDKLNLHITDYAIFLGTCQKGFN